MDAVALQRTFADAVAAYDQGRLAASERVLKRIQKRHPGLADVLHLLALIALRTDRPREAIKHLEKAVRAAPSAAELHHLLGSAFRMAGRQEDSIGAYQQAVALDSGRADTQYNLGNALKAAGRHADAASCYQRAVSLRPDFADAHYNLALALKALRRYEESAAANRRALEINRNDAEALNNLGNVLTILEKWQDAEAAFRRAIELNPDNAEPYCNYGTLLQPLGRVEEALEKYGGAIALKPDYATAHSKFLCCWQYKVGVTAARLKELHDEWDARHGARPLGKAPHRNRRDPEKRLRFGLVSADLGQHPVGFFVLKLLEHRQPDDTEFICYSDREPDKMTERLRAAADAWLDTRAVDIDELERKIRSDRIDILFDLAGHTADNRLPLFVRKPAPVQVTWAGYVGTTGVKAIDYLVADPIHIPAGEEHLYSEKIIRMAHDNICYSPPPYAPAVGPLPAAGNNTVTFGCFNNIAKINAEVLTVWARVLAAVPNSRLVLRSKYMDLPETRERFLPFLAAAGVAPERLVLERESPHPELLARYNDVDIGLDPFPYSGGLTTCEAMWMGVPVVTWPGRTFAGRHSLAHMTVVGVTDSIASGPDDYVARAAALAGDLARLSALRSGLRERMRASPLCDGAGFARHFVAEMRKAWRAWCFGPDA